VAEITDTPVEVGSSSYLIQNLGPDKLYVGGSSVTVETGIELQVGQALTVGETRSSVFVVSDGTSDVRILDRGMGIFTTNPPASEPV